MTEREQNRSEQATPFKLAEARKQGQVAKSLEFNSLLIVGALLMVLLVAGGGIARRLAAVCSWLLSNAAVLRLESGGDTVWLGRLLAEVCGIVAPLAVVSIIVSILANLLQTGPIFTFAPLKPKFERLNPVSGFKRVFSRKMLFEACKTLVKLGLFATVLWKFLAGVWPGPQSADAEAGQQTAWLAATVAALLLRLGLVLLLAGCVDFAYVRWQFHRQMMMSRRELKEEIKRREGDPLIRAKIRELQRENLKQARSLGRVPEADVLITNPQHLAIALRYVRGEMRAPEIIAKGAESWAEQMKDLARRHRIPIFERRQLARHLFKRAQIGHAIPTDSFVDVARIYLEVEAAKARAARYEVAR
ncbi:MAG TPA: EscU/YscU/HrcU family type III secretion system export apparatus switch protein [Steroidobacteraceae bacterium]|jgi:flagellar biosynthetic protein FlhB